MRFYSLKSLIISAILILLAPVDARALSPHLSDDTTPAFHATCRVSESRRYSANSQGQKWHNTEKALTSAVWAEFKYERSDNFVTSVRSGLKREIRYNDVNTILFEIREQGQISIYAVNLALKEITGVQIGASNNQGVAKTGARILKMSCEFH